MFEVKSCPRCGSDAVYTASSPMGCKIKCFDCKYELSGQDMVEVVTKWNDEGPAAALSEETRKVLVGLVNVYQKYANEELQKSVDNTDSKDPTRSIRHAGESSGFLRAMYYIIDELLEKK